MAVNQQAVSLGRIRRLPPGDETLQRRGVGGVEVHVTVFGDFREMGAAGEALDGVLLHSVKPGAVEIVAQERRAFRVLLAAVDDNDQLDSRVVVDRAAHLVGKRHERVVRTVIHGAVEEEGPGALGVSRRFLGRHGRATDEDQQGGEEAWRTAHESTPWQGVVGLWLTDAGATESPHRSPTTVVKAELLVRQKLLQLAQHIEGDLQSPIHLIWLYGAGMRTQA